MGNTLKLFKTLKIWRFEENQDTEVISQNDFFFYIFKPKMFLLKNGVYYIKYQSILYITISLEELPRLVEKKGWKRPKKVFQPAFGHSKVGPNIQQINEILN